MFENNQKVDYFCGMNLKNILASIFVMAAISACNNAQKNDKSITEESDECKQEDKLTATLVDGYYGSAFKEENTLTLENALKNYNEKGEANAQINGEIESVCQSKGCWFDLKGANGTQTIDFGHKFLMHKDLAGKKVIANGSFYSDTTSVKQQIHEAVDDAKSMTLEEAKKKFVSPAITIGFEATGIKILN